MQGLLADVRLRIDFLEFNPTSPEDARPSEWLPPYYRLIPLIGRDDDLAMLAQFRDGEELFSWQAIVGDGGTGKTRLAMEFASDCGGADWYAGLLDRDALEALVENPGFPSWEPLVDTFAIVDYAAARGGALKKFVRRCARYSMDRAAGDDAARLRLLLLERHGDAAHGWLSDLRGCGAGSGALGDRVEAGMRPVVELPPPSDEDPPEIQIVRETFKRWTERTEQAAPVLPGGAAETLARLRGTPEGRPLLLQMAALRACRQNGADITQWRKPDLIEWTADRERKVIGVECREDPPRSLVERAIAMICLSGAQSVEDSYWLKLLREEIEESLTPACQPLEIVNHLETLLGERRDGDVRYLLPIEPDLVRSALTASVLHDAGESRTGTLHRVLDLAGLDGWANLLRMVPDVHEVEACKNAESWLCQLIPNRPFTELDDLEPRLPQYTISLRHFAAKLCEYLVETLPKTPETEPRRAGLFNNLGIRYDDLGRREEALAATQRAVDLYERLAEKNPDAFLHDLANSLNNLGVRYNALGRREEALAATQRAVDLYERLAEKNPDAFMHDLAASVDNLGVMLSALGRREEALAATQRAVDLYERLAEKNPDAFMPDLARSLNNLGMMLSALGRREEALAATQRAVQIRERLAEKNPDAFMPDLAASVDNLGVMLSALGRREEALAATQRAVQIRERLAEKNPDAFMPDLARSLNNLGAMYNALGRREEALAATQRAVDLYERLAEKNPDAFMPDLAMSCGALGSIYAAGSDNLKARESFERGVRILAPYFLQMPRAFAQLMGNLAGEYLKACEASGGEPDMELLGPVAEKFQELQ